MTLKTILFRSAKWLAVLSLVMGRAWAADPKIVLKLAEVHPQGYPTELADEEFARLVNERTGGRIQIEVYPGAQLGDEKIAIEQVQIGALAFTRVSSAPMAQFSKPAGRVLAAVHLRQQGSHVGLPQRGGRPEDARRARVVRVHRPLLVRRRCAQLLLQQAHHQGGGPQGPQVPGHPERVVGEDGQAIGANAIPMAYGQVFSAIQTGVIDGAENNAPSLLTASHYQVAKSYLLDEHLRLPEVLFMSKIGLGTLDEGADQAPSRKAADDSVELQRDQWDAFEVEALDKVKAAGVTVVTEVKDLTPFKKAVKQSSTRPCRKFGEILKAIAAARGQEVSAARPASGARRSPAPLGRGMMA